MGMQFTLFGLPPGVSPEQKANLVALVKDVIIRTTPSGVGSRIERKDILGVFRVAGRRPGEPDTIRVSVSGYPSLTDGSCCTLASRIGETLRKVLPEFNVQPDALQCVVKGWDGHSGMYDLDIKPKPKE